MNITGKRVLITGGSSGIGFALAQVLLAKGAKVAISGRCPEIVSKAVRLLQTGSAEIHGITSDVVTAEGRDARLEQAVAALGGLDVFVNNAGGAHVGRLKDMDEAKLQAMIDVAAPILLTRAALPMLRDSSDAMVVNVSSDTALAGTPFYAIYASVRAGLAHFSEALRRELKRDGIHVLTVYPHGTDMPMIRSNRAFAGPGTSREPASAIAEAIAGGIETGAIDLIRDGEAMLG
ncbi:SDR family NAD(P)-dependent oxidoreductase [Rhizobium sp. LjRoot258]|uniref:SDR family NAD(P)-dependent oxidoreductase n=1 Tax=Rhizobium sp. LjRoot258 TaxID=3342299 RepID=UPI003ECD155E